MTMEFPLRFPNEADKIYAAEHADVIADILKAFEEHKASLKPGTPQT